MGSIPLKLKATWNSTKIKSQNMTKQKSSNKGKRKSRRHLKSMLVRPGKKSKRHMII